MVKQKIEKRLKQTASMNLIYIQHYSSKKRKRKILYTFTKHIGQKNWVLLKGISQFTNSNRQMIQYSIILKMKTMQEHFLLHVLQ